MTIASTQTPAAGQPIPTPSDFPVLLLWDDPDNAKLTWEFNKALKDPVPILVDATVSAFLVGRNGGFELDEQAQWSLETRIGFSNRIPSIQIYTSSSTHPAYLLSKCQFELSSSRPSR